MIPELEPGYVAEANLAVRCTRTVATLQQTSTDAAFTRAGKFAKMLRIWQMPMLAACFARNMATKHHCKDVACVADDWVCM